MNSYNIFDKSPGRDLSYINIWIARKNESLIRMPLLCIDMKEIHGISEGSIVEVTDVARSTFMDVGDDDIVSWLKEGVRLEVRRIKPDIRTSKVTVTMSVVDGQDIPSYRTVVSSTYESWPNGCSRDCHFDADGHTTHYGDKYFDVEVVE